MENADKSVLPNKDFILYFRDTSINTPSGFFSLNEFKEQALMINILSDMMPPPDLKKLKSKLNQAKDTLDTDQNLTY